jgi:hypothetical protein
MTRVCCSFFLALFLPVFAFAAAVPSELTEALKTFRTEGTKGWSFNQTTVASEKSTVEHYDPSKPDFARWTLLKKDGKDPTADETRSYTEKFTRRSRGDTAPNVKDQLNLATCEIVSDGPERGIYRFRLKPGGSEDKSAAFMAATFTLHKPTHTIETVELASLEPFSPVFAVKVQEAKTVMHYSLPTADRPTLLQEITVRIRGRAMWFKSLDEDMSVTYTDYASAEKK